MNPIKDVVGQAKAGLRVRSVNRKLTRHLVDKIGPEGIIGLGNMDTYSKKIRGMINQNKQEDAIKFANQESRKVFLQSRSRAKR